ncbi:hypothetical protein OE88DRAFT_694149 [Heliocybe sulcata]|uniref:Uncharacterized protein n=1 Tax=Heliocybe sulcata TaxID=5364 RepID=A0A5C3NE65_9AGAM|nr:hypothetical protein OE88DRAFT_694149 [Heliocybe sulcata]
MPRRGLLSSFRRCLHMRAGLGDFRVLLRVHASASVRAESVRGDRLGGVLNDNVGRGGLATVRRGGEVVLVVVGVEKGRVMMVQGGRRLPAVSLHCITQPHQINGS